jgi:LETM1 and EF-hand domain-containing protein 1
MINKSKYVQRDSNADLKIIWNRFEQGDPITTEEFIVIAKSLENSVTFESMSRENLVSMCQYMSISTFGTETRLINQLYSKMDKIRADDFDIAKEGLVRLSIPELKQACKDRGLKVIGVSSNHLRRDLQTWIDLSLNHNIPPALMVINSAFTLSGRIINVQASPLLITKPAQPSSPSGSETKTTDSKSSESAVSPPPPPS